MNVLEKILNHAQNGTLPKAFYRKIRLLIKRTKNRIKFLEYQKIGKSAPFLGVRAQDYTYIVSTRDRHAGFNLFNQYNADFGARIKAFYDWCHGHLGWFEGGDKLLINVGANIGGAVIPSIKSGYFRTAIAFEPEPLNFKLLEVNLKMNDVEDKVKAYPLALSNENRMKEMYVSEHNFGAHSVFDQKVNSDSLSGRDKSNKIKPGLQVECQTMDHFLKTRRIAAKDIGFVFMDIEGHEGHFFAGAQLLLNKKIPMVTEFCPQFLKRSGGLEMFLDNVLAHYKQMVIGPFKKKPEAYEIVNIEGIKELEPDKIYDLLLIP